MNDTLHPQVSPPAAAADEVLSASGLRKRFGTREAVRGVSLSLRRGEILGLLGPNGAGKSTTVAMLCGLLRPDAGTVQVLGQPIGADADPRKARIGLVPQELALYEVLSARQNLEAFGRLYGLGGGLLAGRIERALALSGLQERARDRVDGFSGGMKRRLNIACALLHEPDIVVLDEPTVGIDPQSRNAIFDTLEQLRDQGRALIYTTHYMEEAQRLCERLVIMDHGEVIAQGRLRELLAGLAGACVLRLQWAAAPGAELEARLRALAGVQALQRLDERTLRLTLAGAEHLAPTCAALGALGLPLQGLQTEEASVEQLFLALTGRQLRD
ncbi:ABC transporter ATP-binding protein [Pelomonas sp. CA6]|uniref:ABC transporter ATP-binding protein n=1 Tax=Pelomonas sp. CA6 TaxID=2907999 RepID=UPI001F4BD83C|nr:ABC transporter ATP-binding protein [Pelomonas sp. CA6]MCH7344964.1 ABC transporter ATP-binding protein [Pelomonas sp. CA6]